MSQGHVSNQTRILMNHELASAIAKVNCGKFQDAKVHASRLKQLLTDYFGHDA